MKFVSFRYKNKNSFGLIKNNKIVDLTECIEGTRDLREAIKKDQLSELMELSLACHLIGPVLIRRMKLKLYRTL